MNEFEERNRALKAAKIVALISRVHADLKSTGVLGRHSVPHVWVKHPSFPWDALARAAKVNPPSETTKALVRELLSEAEAA